MLDSGDIDKYLYPNLIILQLLLAAATSHRVQVFVWEPLPTLAILKQLTAALRMTTATMMYT